MKFPPQTITQETDCAAQSSAATITRAEYEALKAELAEQRWLINEMVRQQADFWRAVVGGVNEHLKVDTRSRDERRRKN